MITTFIDNEMHRTERPGVALAKLLLSLPDETLDAILAEALPDACMPLTLSSLTSIWGDQQYTGAVQSLSQVCHQIHWLLLPKLYHFILLLSPNNKCCMAFLELMPSTVGCVEGLFF